MIRHVLSIVTALMLAAPAAAQPAEIFVPRLFDVAGVEDDDTLNIRAEPSASAPIIGELAPDAQGIEVTAFDPGARWGRVGAGELDGWVSLAYLAERAFPTGDVPEGMRCLGTEPFWSIAFGDRTISYSSPVDSWREMPLRAAATRIPPGNQLFGFDGSGSDGSLSGVIEAGWCSDGMSDRTYGWKVTLMHQTGERMSIESGCCTLDGR